MSIRKGSTVIASYIADADVVHTTGTETIAGAKTFKGDVGIQSTGNNALFDNSNSSAYLRYSDKSGHVTGWVESLVNHDGTTVSPGVSTLRLWAKTYTDNTFGTDVNACIDVISKPDGTHACRLPTDAYGTYFHGTADYAKWADLAECYQPDQKYPVGTLICFGGEKDITIAKVNCNGVISDKPGYVLDSELEDAQPVALVGKTPLRVLGKVKKFDRIVLDPENPGIGKVQVTSDEKIIAVALEASEIEEEKLVLCVTKFNLD